MKLPSASSPIWSRRRFVRESAVFSATWPLACRALAVPAPATHQATGVRVGEATDHSAIVWVRLTENGERNNEGFVFPKKGKKAKPVPVNLPVKDIEGACPGMAGRVRLRYGLKEDLSDAVETEWVGVSAATDFIHHFHLANLKPGSTYHYISETAGAEGEPAHRGFAVKPGTTRQGRHQRRNELSAMAERQPLRWRNLCQSEAAGCATHMDNGHGPVPRHSLPLQLRYVCRAVQRPRQC